MLMSLAQSAQAAERVTFTGKLEPAVCHAACGACCGAYLLQDGSKQINVYAGNSFVDLSGVNVRSSLHRFSGSFYETTGQCGLSQCTLFMVEDVDQAEGGVAEYDARTDTLEVPVARIADSKERFAVTLKAPFSIEQLTPLGSLRRMNQGQSCTDATDQCAVGQACVTVADGPGKVCQALPK